MEIMRVCGIGYNLQRLIQRYSDEQSVVTKTGKLFGRPFVMDRGVKQGDLVSLKIFNILVDEVIRAVLLEVCGPQEAHNWLGWAAGGNTIIFYADDGRIAVRNPISVQTNLTTVARMFERVELITNLGKPRAMVCTPGFIWRQQGTS